MTNKNQFDHQNDPPQINCARCEAAISDAIDSSLGLDGDFFPTHIRQAMELHLAGCAACARLYDEAQRGQAWLGFLKAERPTPPESLAARILAQTSLHPMNAIAPALAVVGATPAQPRGFRMPSFAAIRSVLFHPQLAMTAAMAFFSITLTMNVTGVKLGQIHVADLSPSSLQRRFYQADAQVIRYYDNLRVVNDVESNVAKIQQLRSNDNTAPDSPAAEPNQNQQSNPQTPKGTSHRDVPQHNFHAQVPDLPPSRRTVSAIAAPASAMLERNHA
jgi:hypothetical protein